MSLSLMMRGNWDGLSMASPQLQSYKPERPVYSTPHPVQSTPANNECKLVELRGADVASFIIGDEEYICLPQAFDLFLKHLVGGLHTVYTKLKRLNITPVVCNVEQVRVLRGLGAIQPGVNRCKLITRKDFETLYQDCTTASRPGRPPKRYPVLPPADLMSHHPSARALNHPRGILGSPDLGNFHKRLRLDHEGNFHQQQERRMSTSPTRHSPSMGRKYASGAEELYANAANIYLQQALRQQYQQFLANGIHNGMNSQHGANVNAALAPFIGMSNPGFFNGSIPQHILSHINEYARNNMGDSGLNEREERDEQTSPGGSPHQKPGNSIKPLPTHQRRQSLGRSLENSAGASESDNDIDDMRRERPTTSPRQGFNRGMNDRSSPVDARSPSGRKSVGDVSASSSDYGKKYEGDNCQDRSLSRGQETEELNSTHAKYHGGKGNNIIKSENQRNQSGSDDLGDWQTAMPSTPNISCMQTLLSNIQGLLKVAADNAKLQDKQLSFEIAELKNRVTKEQELRGLVERKLEESERIRASIQRKLDREREAVRRLQEQKNGNNEKSPSKEEYKQNDDDIDVTSSPSENGSPHRSLTASPQNHASRSESTREGNCPSTESNTCSEFAAHASPASASSPKSINDYWGGRQMNVNRNQSPERSSPVNMTANERNWMACNLVRSGAK